MTDTERIIVHILGATDAVWLPQRGHYAPLGSNTFLARRDFAKTGVPWRSGESSEAGRKGAQRALEAVVSSGLLAAHRPRKAKTLGAMLTDEGEARARALCGLPSLAAGVATVAEVERLSTSPGAWVAETVLSGAAYDEPGANAALMDVEDMALPVLTRGWLAAHSTIHGHVCYRVTEAGREILSGLGALDLPEVDSGADEAARAQYFQSLTEMQSRLAHDQPLDRREIGLCPLSVAALAPRKEIPQRT